MPGKLKVVPGDGVISDVCVVVFWFGVNFFFQTLQRKYLHPVCELLISDTEQSLHGCVTTDADHTLIFFSTPPLKINFALFFRSVRGRGRLLF